MKKQPEKTRKTRQGLVNAFCELYAQKPIEKITVQEITKKAGHNRSTFYQYFPDLLSLRDYVEDDVLDFMRQKSQVGKASSEQIIAMLYGEKGLCFNALLCNLGKGHFVEKFKRDFPIEVPELALPEDDPLLPYLIEFHRSAIISLFSLWHRRGKDLTSEELVRLVCRLYKNGLARTDG